MIAIKEFLKGFVGLNLCLLPFHIFVCIELIKFNKNTIFYGSEIFSETIKIYSFLVFFLVMVFSPQILLLLGLIFCAKLYDLIFLRSRIMSKILSKKGTIFGAIVISIIITTCANVYFDNLFQFERGHYFIAMFPPFVMTILYYGICYGTSVAINSITSSNSSLKSDID